MVPRVIFSLFCLLFCETVFAQQGDQCQVYLLDVEAGRAALEEYFKSHDQQQVKDTPDPENTLGTFSAEVGEEKLTTRHFPIPQTKLVVTAGVFYTDESMILQKKGAKTPTYESIVLVIALSEREMDNPYDVADNAIAETTYTEDTLGAKVSKRIMINGKPFELGMDCHCNGSTPPQETRETRK
ncbi:MAG TPA: hypothetical protein VM182_09770 [Terriglobia bacterium]|nr:hypothetical protein [Terriglobia bacterium]